MGVGVRVCTNNTTPEYNILYRVCIECTPITHWEWVWELVRMWVGVEFLGVGLGLGVGVGVGR